MPGKSEFYDQSINKAIEAANEIYSLAIGLNSRDIQERALTCLVVLRLAKKDHENGKN